MAKELTARELYLQDHVPEITKKSDPFDSLIDPLSERHDSLQKKQRKSMMPWKSWKSRRSLNPMLEL